MHMKNSSMQNSFLRQVLMQPRVVSCLLATVLAAAAYNASPESLMQQADVPVNGVVTDVSGEPLTGVSVIVEETNIGTVTGADGRFSFNVFKSDAMLVFSYVGYERQKIKVGSARTLNVVMKEDAALIDEVVVVGYGIQKKESVVSAITNVNVGELKIAAPRSINNILAGKVSGVISVQRSGEPGKDDAQFWIRGISTFGAGSEPLVLVDGVERSLSNVEPEDIENFSVLKDASATSIYGIKGANGVILITTRRGKTGEASINFKYETGMQRPIAMPQFVDAPTYLELMNEAQLATNPSYVTPYTPDIIAKYRSGEDPWLFPNVNWIDWMMKDRSTSQRFTVNASGGTEKARYYIAGSYYGESGIWNSDPAKDYDSSTRLRRINFRSNIDLVIAKNLEANLGMGGYLMLGNYPGENNSGSLWYNTMLATPAKYHPTAPDPEDPRETVYLTSGGSGNINPYALLVNSGFTSTWSNTLQTDIGLKYDASDILKGLKAGAMLSYDAYSHNDIKRTRSGDQWIILGRNLTSGELELDRVYSGSKELSYNPVAGGNRKIYFQANADYSRTFGDHSVSGLILYNMQDYQDGDATQSIYGIPYRMVGLVGRATYNFRSKYFVEVNAGYNGSENFERGHRFGFFPSIAGGWIISQEPFFQQYVKSHIMDYLKIRASYGIKGNDKIWNESRQQFRRFAYLTTIGGGYGEYVLGKDVNTHWYSIGEDEWGANLTWEKEKEVNLGIESRFLDGFYLQADFFKRHRSQIYTERYSMPALIGTQKRPRLNIGEFENKGIDATLEYTKRFGDLRATFRGNYTFARNNLLENDIPDELYPYQNARGKRLNQPFGLIAEGLFTSQEEIDSSPEQTFGTQVRTGDIRYRDINGDGKIDTYDRVAIGNPDIPEGIYGFGVSLEYRGFDISIFFQGAANMDFMLGGDGFFPFLRGESQGNVAKWTTDRWTEDSPRQDALFPRLSFGDNQNNYQSSTWWQRKADYLRIKTAEAGYTFPKKLTSKLRISALRIYVSGLNLHTFSSFRYWDPELGNGNGAAYPLQSTYTAGLNLNF
jgi:TonB-linked SusC/RagA family outer membrane protein